MEVTIPASMPPLNPFLQLTSGSGAPLLFILSIIQSFFPLFIPFFHLTNPVRVGLI